MFSSDSLPTPKGSDSEQLQFQPLQPLREQPPVAKERVCSCGASVADGHSFCGQCGTRFQDISQERAPSSGDSGKPTPSLDGWSPVPAQETPVPAQETHVPATSEAAPAPASDTAPAPPLGKRAVAQLCRDMEALSEQQGSARPQLPQLPKLSRLAQPVAPLQEKPNSARQRKLPSLEKREPKYKSPDVIWEQKAAAFLPPPRSAGLPAKPKRWHHQPQHMDHYLKSFEDHYLREMLHDMSRPGTRMSQPTGGSRPSTQQSHERWMATMGQAPLKSTTPGTPGPAEPVPEISISHGGIWPDLPWPGQNPDAMLREKGSRDSARSGETGGTTTLPSIGGTPGVGGNTMGASFGFTGSSFPQLSTTESWRRALASGARDSPVWMRGFDQGSLEKPDQSKKDTTKFGSRGGLASLCSTLEKQAISSARDQVRFPGFHSSDGGNGKAAMAMSARVHGSKAAQLPESPASARSSRSARQKQQARGPGPRLAPLREGNSTSRR